MTDESNGESTFEFVEKKQEDTSISGDIVKADSFSSLSSAASLLTPLGFSTSTGNLLSNLAPPIALPKFVSSSGSLPSETQVKNSSSVLQKEPIVLNKQPAPSSTLQTTQLQQQDSQQIPVTIPPASVTQNFEISDIQISTTQAQDTGVVGSGLFSWIKETLANSNVLSKVAEKLSVDNMITTLDPQMREFIYSGGDIEIVVASDKDIKISPVRQAFQSVFGKATVTGIAVDSSDVAAQPVGFAAGLKGAAERINSALSKPSLPKDVPIVAIENFLVEVGEDKWYDVGVIVLHDRKNKVNLQTFTQMTPVPSQIVALAQQSTPEDYPFKWSGLAVTVGSLMASNLQVSHTEWHHALTGVSRRDIILLAVQSLAGIYKNTILPV